MVAAIFYATIALLLFNFHILLSEAQQEYVNNRITDCDSDFNSTDGNLCNSVNSCSSYLTFRAISPYNDPPNIASLLNSTPALIAKANNISDVENIPNNTMVIVPVNCSCSGRFYQHNASYVLKYKGENYYAITNNTYQFLTSCRAMVTQNTYGASNLTVGLDLLVPLRCACPTSKQSAAGIKYLLTYVISPGDTLSSIADLFGVDMQSVMDANELSTSMIYGFSPLLIPLKKEPTKIQTVASPPPPPPPPPVSSGGGDSSSSKKWVIVGITAGVALLLLASLVVFLCFYRRRKNQSVEARHFSVSTATDPSKKLSETTTTTTNSWSISSAGIRYAIDSLSVYKFEDLQKATSFFSEANRIKDSVYRATFDGDAAVVKILKGDVSAEINILKRINHTNIIRLSGFCVYKGNTYLVYEFAENGSLDDWLHTKKYQNSLTLNWRQRVQIAYDIAGALNYLHNYTNPPHVHKNLKSGNVLLDGNFRAKVSNFGLARAVDDEEGFQLTRHVIGTQGYMPTEYIENGVITPKMDVFAFGVVILELLTGKQAMVGDKNGTGEELLSVYASQVLEGENVREKLQAFMDPTLRDEYPSDLAYSMAQIAKRCVAREINSRPTISEILMTLFKIQSSTLDWDPSDELEKSKSISQMSEI